MILRNEGLTRQRNFISLLAAACLSMVLTLAAVSAGSLPAGSRHVAGGGENALSLFEDPTETPSDTPEPQTNTATYTLAPTETLTPTVAPNKLAEWHLDETSGNANDSAGFNNVGSRNGPTWNTFGVLNGALLFDGSNDYLSVSDHAEIKPASSFSISAWIYPTAAGGGTVRTILMKSANQDYVLRLNADGFIEFWINDLVSQSITGPIPPLNTWTYIVGAYDNAAGQLSLYVNGVLVSTHSTSGSLSYDSQALRIGANLSAAQAWKGRLDEITIYDRALSSSEVASRYGSISTPTPTWSASSTNTATPTATATPTLPPSSLLNGLISYWKLDETSGTRMDSQGSNNLTDNNTVTSATGVSNNAGDFEASTSEFLEKTDNASLSTGDIDFTVSAWVKLESESTTPQTILGKIDSATVREYILAYTGSDYGDTFFFRTFDSAGAVVCTTFSQNYVGIVTTNTWYHIVGWHDANANTCNLQVDNTNAYYTSESGVPADKAANFRIGAQNATEILFWDGLIDEVGFWKRVLNEDERTALYGEGSGLSYPFIGGPLNTPIPSATPSITPTFQTLTLFTDLISSWPLDETSGTRADAHGSNDLSDVGSIPGAQGLMNIAADFEFEATPAQGLTINDNASLSSGSESLTIASWIKIESEDSPLGVLAIKPSEYGMGYIAGDGYVVFAFSVYSVQDCNAYYITELSLENWFYVVGWYDVIGNTCNVQVNNNQTTTILTNNPPQDTSNAFTIGYQADGLIDDTTFWKRVLSEYEREILYNTGLGLAYPFDLNPTETPTSTPIPSPTPTATPQAGWEESNYDYSSSRPHAVTSVERVEN